MAVGHGHGGKYPDSMEKAVGTCVVTDVTECAAAAFHLSYVVLSDVTLGVAYVDDPSVFPLVKLSEPALMGPDYLSHTTHLLGMIGAFKRTAYGVGGIST